MTKTVFANRGPMAGRRFEVEDEDVEAATGAAGWGVVDAPGANLTIGDMEFVDPTWKVPGQNMAAYAPEGAQEAPASETTGGPAQSASPQDPASTGQQTGQEADMDKSTVDAGGADDRTTTEAKTTRNTDAGNVQTGASVSQSAAKTKPAPKR